MENCSKEEVDIILFLAEMVYYKPLGRKQPGILGGPLITFGLSENALLNCLKARQPE